LLKWTEKSEEQGPAVRGGGQKFWQKDIRLPSYVVVALGITAFFIVLVFEVGLFWLKIIGLLAFLIMVFIFLTIYLHNEQPAIPKDSEAVMLLGLIFISSIFLMQLAKDWPLATPLAAAALLIGLLISKRLAFIVSIILSLIFGVLNNFNLGYVIVMLFGCFTSIAGIPGIRARKDLVTLGIKVAVTNVAMIIIVHFYMHGLSSLASMKWNIAYGATSGVVSALIVLIVLPYLETFFSRTTSIKLLELSDFNQPLLRRLMMEAPGTYHHSLIMASLAEQCAEAIGANALLARVGAYYHDIGKLVKPDYFIENQQTMGNPHDPLSPTMSSLVVTSHVKEGAALARQYNLDKVIIDMIEQHHGTSLIHYFYHRALEQNPDTKPQDFRYPGPKPRSKEAAILMLSDSAEAASRAVDDPSPGRLKDTVETVINNKFTDGQFAECPITLRDLSKIAETLASVLSGIHHARIEYQQTDTQEEDKH
jgi:putative nucleotidyltransferase with HDIG domain